MAYMTMKMQNYYPIWKKLFKVYFKSTDQSQVSNIKHNVSSPFLATDTYSWEEINLYPNIWGCLNMPEIQFALSAHVIMKMSSFMIPPHLLLSLKHKFLCSFSQGIVFNHISYIHPEVLF